VRRLFVAAELPAEVRARLAAAAPGPPWRPVGEAALHVTLVFLGARPDEHAEAAGAVLDAVAGPTLEAELGEGLLLPPRRPRVCAVRVVSPGLDGLRARLAEGLVARGLHEREPRPFLGHVTLARARGRVPREAPAASGRFTIASVAVFESRPGSGGARYVALHRSTLAP
jgi:RNA 2',3'-cyclic 3'-phosphodiesterase